MKNKVMLGCLAILLCSTSIAFGYVLGGSNLSLGQYPSFTQYNYRPTRPYSNDQFSSERYRDEVKQYVEKAKEYAENCNNDVQRIYDAKSEAINEANLVVQDYNSYAQGY